MTDPTAIINLLSKVTQLLYHLRLDLRNTPKLLSEIEFNVTQLEMSSRKLRHQLDGKILSQEDFENLTTCYKTFDDAILAARDKLFMYTRNSNRLVNSICFRFGPKDELLQQMAALKNHAGELEHLQKLTFPQQLTLPSSEKNEAEGFVSSVRGQAASGYTFETLLSVLESLKSEVAFLDDAPGLESFEMPTV